MAKHLRDFTREDFNQLYPVELKDHNPDWKHIFEKEKKLIQKRTNPNQILRIEHFGSTSIAGIKAKPYIDLLIEIPQSLLFDQELIHQFEQLGYTHWEVPQRENIDAYMSFGKGYNAEGRNEQIFHIHMCPKENAMWNQLKFKDYLNSNPERAQAYEALKLDLASKYRHDRGSYVLSKTEFIKETLKMIEEESGEKK
jgi:GrpB-like predicted nucleotidyltransferase (UPF0157 family)